MFSQGHHETLCDGQQAQRTPSSEQPLSLPPPGAQTSDDRQTVRHVLLCLLLFVSLLAVSSTPQVCVCVCGCDTVLMSHPFCPCLCAEPVQLSVVAVQQRSRKTLPWTTVLLCCSKLWAGTGVWWCTTVERREVTTTFKSTFLFVSVCVSLCPGFPVLWYLRSGQTSHHPPV